MNIYRLPLAEETKSALAEANSGVRSVAASSFSSNVPGVDSVYLELEDGRWLSVHAGQQDLEARFEVFPIATSIIDSKPKTKFETDFVLEGPVTIAELETEDWLDPTAPCGETLGTNPIAQFQDFPHSAPETASAKCNYISGVRFEGRNGKKIVIATLAFPYSVYCSVFPERASQKDSPHVQATASAP
jgi:hypothetical protein